MMEDKKKRLLEQFEKMQEKQQNLENKIKQKEILKIQK